VEKNSKKSNNFYNPVENKKYVHLPRWKSAQSGLQCKNVKFKNSNFVLTPVKSKFNFPTPGEFLMLRITPVKFDFLESHSSGLRGTETGVYVRDIHTISINYII